MFKAMTMVGLLCALVVSHGCASSPCDAAASVQASAATTATAEDADNDNGEDGVCGISCPDGVGQCLSGQICDNHECRWP